MADNNTEVVSEYYENYTEVQKDVLAFELRKTRNTLLIVSAIIFVGDLLGLLATNALDMQTFLFILVIPALLAGLAFLALKEPLLSMIIASVIIGGIWIYLIIATGGRAAIMGWLIKAVIVYFIISGFRHANEASRIKKELKI